MTERPGYFVIIRGDGVALGADGALQILFGAQLHIRQRVAADVAKPALHEPALVAGGHVLKVEHPQKVVADSDQVPFTKTCRLN